MRKIAFAITCDLFAVGLLAFAVPLLPAQTNLAPATQAPTADSKLPAFDVVSIKQNKNGLGPAMINSPQNGDSVTITNMSLHMMIGFAFDISLHDGISGLPAWADSENYDVVAKVSASDLPAFHKLLPRQRNPMLQAVLEDRFHLKFHYQTKDVPAYALVVAKNSPKLTAIEQAIAPNGIKNPGGIHTARGQLTAEGAAMSNFADVLSLQLGRPVIDKTGLTGHYNFTLTWTPDQGAAATPSRADTDSGPSLFTAVQEQLGLKLQSTKAPVPTLVVDHIERSQEN